jgi:tetratricopeptide (TPR) repeat protein
MDQPDIVSLENQAIQAALNNKWKQAVKINQKIIKLSPKNPSALNRLGIAYLKTSKNSLAKKTFRHVLKINPKNPIATKNLSKLKHQLKEKSFSENLKPKSQIISFIEEPGISKIVPLIKPGNPQVIANLEIGQNLTLKLSARKIKVFSEDKGEYLGRLPDNLSLNLSRLMKLGYKYQAFIKSTNPQSPQIFIQEIKRSKRLKDVPSFPINNNKKTINISGGRPVNPPLQIFDPLAEED